MGVFVPRLQSQHNACMVSITIRDVPQDTRNELAARAARSGRSLQEYLRSELVELASRPDVEVVLARIRERKESAEIDVGLDTIVADVEADRR